MAGKNRSPKYPLLGLPDALQKIDVVWKSNQRHAAPREVIAKSLGYSALHGKSLRLIAALIQYGLLEKQGKELRVSQLAMMYLHPESPDERKEAIRKAAASPELFGRLAEKYPGSTPSDGLILNFLVRQGFLEKAAVQAIRVYRETIEFVEKECGRYTEDSRPPAAEDSPADEPEPVSVPTAPPQSSHVAPGKFRVAMDEDFLVEVHATGLYQEGVDQLVKWLKANKPLVPTRDSTASKPDEDEAEEGEPC